MTRRAACLLSLVLAALAALAAPAARAQDREAGFDAGSLVPVTSKDIQLVRQTVDLDLPLGADDAPGRAFCRYVLGNTSSNQRTITLSFLAGEPSGFDGETPAAPAIRIEVDGIPIRFHYEKTNRKRWSKFDIVLPDSIPVWELTIPGRGSAHVDVEHEIRWTSTINGDDAAGGTEQREIHYFARPSQLWSGRVTETTVRLHFGRVATALLRTIPEGQEKPIGLRFDPDYATWTATGLVWRRSNWDPNHDFRFVVEWEFPGEDE